MHVQKPRGYYFDDFRLDVSRRRLLRENEIVTLNPKAFDLLLVLVENSGLLLSKNDLFERVWQGQIVEESNLTVNMSAIRRALCESAKKPRYITTVSGEGYCFVADVHSNAETVPESSPGFVVESRSFERIIIEQEEVAIGLPALAAAHRNLNRTFVTASLIIGLLSLFGIGGYFVRRAWPAKNVFSQSGPVSIRKLTNNGNVGSAALSLDGKLYAFSMYEAEKSSLWLGYADGGEPIQIRPPADMIYLYIRFSPDGTSIYYVSSENYRRGDLYRIPTLGGVAEKLTDDVKSAVTFAPDKKRMAFVRMDADTQKQSLVITDLQGSNELKTVANPLGFNFSGGSPAWSPDGNTIAIAAGNQDNSAARIFMVKVADKSVELFSTDIWGSVNGLSWFHDGSGLVVVAREKSALAIQLWQVAFPGGENRRLLSDLNLYNGLVSLSADDHSLLAVQIEEESNIWTSSADDLTKAKQITFGSPGQNNGWNGLEWLSDGRLIYTKRVSEGITLWTAAGDGGGQRQLIPGGGTNIYPSVADDEKYVVFQSNRGGNTAVWRADIDGSNLVQLTGVDVAGQPRVSPDGKWVVYVSDFEGVGDLLRISIDGGQPVKLSDTQFSWIDISPDSTLIAGSCDQNDKPKLCIIPIGGGQIVSTFDVPRLSNFRLGVRWADNGRSICYRDWRDGIWRQPLAGGPPTLIKDLPDEKFYGYGWSPDNKQFAYTRGHEIKDAVLISGLGKF